jgi:hypothetical protein
MTGWAIYALVVVAGPLGLIVRWLLASKPRESRRARLNTSGTEDPHSVAAIRARVERERADELAAWPEHDPDAATVEPITDVLPITEPDGPPTDVLPASRARTSRGHGSPSG